MKSYRLVLTAGFGLLLFTASGLWGQRMGVDPRRDVRGVPTINQFSRYGEATLKFRKTLYEPGEKIPVTFRIRNRGYTTIRIYPSLRPNRSFQFLVTDRNGREVPLRFNSAAHQRREHGRRTVNHLGEAVKEVILHPGESFQKVIFLNDFYQLEPGRRYRIRGYFYPDARNGFFVRTVNMSLLRIARNRELNYRTRGSQDFFRDSLPAISPEETVFLFLSAEMRRNWRNYMKYLDLRKYIMAYDRFASKYAAASQLEKPILLRRFERFLTGEPADRLKSFRITKKEFDRSENGEIIPGGRAYITVRAERRNESFSLFYNYRFVLEHSRVREGFWKIVYVTAEIVR